MNTNISPYRKMVHVQIYHTTIHTIGTKISTTFISRCFNKLTFISTVLCSFKTR